MSLEPESGQRKLLLITFYYPPDLCAGSFRSAALVRELLQVIPPGTTIDVVTTQPNRYGSFKQQAVDCESDDKVTVHRIALPGHKSGMVDQSISFATFYRKAFALVAGKRYDLVFATSSRLLTAFLGVRLAARHGTPVYLDIRDIFVDTIKDVLGPKASFFMHPVLSLLERYTFRSCDRINLVSRGFHPYFRARYPEVPYDFFTNGIDEEFLGAFPEEGQKKPSQGRIKVLYAGNIGEGQGLHNILPSLAASCADRFDFTVVGDGGRRGELESRVARLGLHNVTLLPPVDREALVRLYRDADVLFLHLNDYEAFKKVLPSKIFEYAATGKPILAGVSGYAEQFIKEEVENAEIFEPCHERAGSEALHRLRLEFTPRLAFVQRYRRSSIMQEMSQQLVSLARGERGHR